MYKCDQCGGNCVVVGGKVICEVCNYEVPKDTADKTKLLNVCEKVLAHLSKNLAGFNKVGGNTSTFAYMLDIVIKDTAS